MKKLLSIICLLALTACFGEEEPEGPIDRGVCYKLPEDKDKLPEGERCKDGDVFCTSDNKCHSACSKCPSVK